MKKLIITSAITLFSSLIAYAQISNWKYEVHGTYNRSLKKGKLKDVLTLNDILPGYPTNWITSYVSVEISASCGGKVRKGLGKGPTLSAEQKTILNEADLATKIVINVKYRYKNSFTKETENNTMHVSATVVPEIEAEFIGGQEQMQNYLKESGIYKLTEAASQKVQQASVKFTVNEQGEIINAKLDGTSGDLKVDGLLLEVIYKMPKWRAAEDSKGAKVKQEFVLVAPGKGGC